MKQERQELYVCEYSYILYKVLIRATQEPDTIKDLIVTDSTQNLKPLCREIEKTGLFRRVIFFDSGEYREYYHLLYCQYPKQTWRKYLFVLKNYLKMSLYQKKFKKIQFPFSLDFRAYDKIYCSDHPYVINGYLAQNKISYSLLEHARNVYQYVSGVYNLFYLFLEKMEWTKILSGLRCTSKYCREIVVNDAGRLPSCTRKKRVTEWNVEQAVDRLTAEEKNRIFEIYANAYGLKLDDEKCYHLLLTNPLLNDAFVSSEENQMRFYADLIQTYFSPERPLLIKPHPRDAVDYRPYFPSAVIVPHEIASEIINFSRTLKIDQVLTLYSTSAESFRKKAEKIICLYPDTSNPSKMDILENYR